MASSQGRPSKASGAAAEGKGAPPSAAPAFDVAAVKASSLAGLELPVAVPDGPDRIDYYLPLGERTYRARGVMKNTADTLKVQLRLIWEGKQHTDVLDLNQARLRRSFARDAHEELGIEEDVVRKDLGLVYLKLEDVRDEHIRELLEKQDAPPVMDPAAEAAALERLKSPKLLEGVLANLDLFIAGESTNKKLAYLATTSRLLEAPLAIIVQSSSAAGKSALMEAVLGLMPPEVVEKHSALTQQALYYRGKDMAYRILALSEEEGAARASYSLKLLLSEGELSILSTGKDPVTGELVTKPYKVKGPVMIFTTTTRIELDPELENRCLILVVDEGREQTRAIHQMQRMALTAEGSRARRKREAVKELHRNMQRLLRPLEVRAPFAHRLTFPDHATRTRRDHAKYLTLLQAIALLHQHQRPIKREKSEEGDVVEYIEVTKEDLAIAKELAGEVLGRRLDDLAPMTHRVLETLLANVKQRCEELHVVQEDYRFHLRDVRAWTGLGHSQAHMHLDRLVKLEYVLMHRSSRGLAYDFELLYRGEGRDGRRFLLGVGAAAAGKEGRYPGFSGGYPGLQRGYPGGIRPQSGPNPGGIRTPSIELAPLGANGSNGSGRDRAENEKGGRRR